MIKVMAEKSIIGLTLDGIPVNRAQRMDADIDKCLRWL